ncbi:MAG: Ig-like domain-containing protein [Planctomycetes bacterium]|nr:Ig-like domain-containing protein [Planctomycetota bacterium]
MSRFVFNRASRFLGGAIALAVLAVAFPSCGGGGGGGSSGGRLTIRNISWGRLVNVVDVNGAEVRPDYVIGEDIISDGQSYELTFNPVTEIATLRILRTQQDPAWQLLFDRLTAGLGTVLSKGYDAIPPFSLVPRNAALRFKFSGDVDESTLDNTTLQVFAGVPPTTPLNVRYIVDPIDPTVVVVDPTITLIDQATTGTPVNATGFPSSVDPSTPNISIRIPTLEDPGAGQTKILLSRSGSPLSSVGNGPTDSSNSSIVVRAFRAGNALDQNRGFLLDLAAPRLLGEQPVAIVNQTATQLAYEFDVAACLVVPDRGDVIQQGNRFAEITEILDASPPDFLVNVRRLDNVGGLFSTVQRAQYVSPFDQGSDLIDCFARFTPFAITMPTNGVDPTASISLRFSEPMDPTTISPFDSMMVSRNPNLATLTYREFAMGEVVPSPDNRQFTFQAAAPGLAHDLGTSETYYLHLRADQQSPFSMRDLAGNALDFDDQAISFTIDSARPSVKVDSFVFRFSTQDEDNSHPNPPTTTQLIGSEWRGQFQRFTELGFVRGRPVTRFQVPVDPSQPVIAQKIAFTQPIQTPLVPLGSRMMTVWRYIDLGLTYDDESGYNIDVERLSWSPFGGQVIADIFPRMEIHLSHCQFLPDEYIDPGSQMPTYPNSGLNRSTFSNNVLSQTAQLKVVDSGYSFNNLDAFIVPGSGSTMVPFPIFEDDFGQKVTYTWRDTTIESRAAPNGVGADPMILDQIFGPNSRRNFAAANQVPTIGLPLLMDYRVYPDQGSQSRGLNGFQISLAGVTSNRPNFRVFSSGGFNTQNQRVSVDPNNNTPRGGFDPTTTPPGRPTPADDPVIYWGQADFVIRISRGITRWLDTQVVDPTFSFPRYQPPVIEPLESEQPAGTNFFLDFRGSDNVVSNTRHLQHAECVNLYGDPMPTAILAECTPNGAATGISPWTRNITSVNGKRFLQMRFTLVNNLATGGVPTISTIGLGWLRLP